MPGKTTGGAKRKPAAKKTNLKSGKTKSVKSYAGTRTGTRSKKVSKNNTDKTPIFVLAIMALLTVIIIMLINDYKTGKKIEKSDTDNTKEFITKKSTKDKKIIKEKLKKR